MHYYSITAIIQNVFVIANMGMCCVSDCVKFGLCVCMHVYGLCACMHVYVCVCGNVMADIWQFCVLYSYISVYT